MKIDVKERKVTNKQTSVQQTVIDAFHDYYKATSNFSTSKDLVEDYGMDNIDLAQIVLRINETHGLHFIWEDFDQLLTVEIISKMIEENLK